MTQRHPVQADQVMFVTTNTLRRRPIFASPAHAREAVEVLYRVQEQHPFFLFGFVIMPDHAHVLLHVPEPENIARVMRAYKSGLAHSIAGGPLWQQRYHIVLPRQPFAALRYIHRNPVRAGLAASPEDYPWSSASGQWDVSEMVLG